MAATDPIGFERLEALLRGQEPATQGERRRAALLAELRAGSRPAPARLRARVLSAKSPPRWLSVGLPSRRLALVLVTAAAGVAVLAAAVHGVVSPEPRAAGAFSARASAPVAKAAPAIGSAPAPEAAPRATAPARGRSGRIVHSGLGFLALEGRLVLAVLASILGLLALVAAGLAVGEARRRRDGRRLLSSGRREDLME
jgi:hypothetical protein